MNVSVGVCGCVFHHPIMHGELLRSGCLIKQLSPRWLTSGEEKCEGTRKQAVLTVCMYILPVFVHVCVRACVCFKMLQWTKCCLKYWQGEGALTGSLISSVPRVPGSQRKRSQRMPRLITPPGGYISPRRQPPEPRPPHLSTVTFPVRTGGAGSYGRDITPNL